MLKDSSPVSEYCVHLIPWKMRPPCCLKMSDTSHPVMWCHIPQKQRPVFHRAGRIHELPNLKISSILSELNLGINISFIFFITWLNF